MIAMQSTTQPAVDSERQTKASYSLTDLGLIAGIPFAIGLVTILIGVGIGVCLAKQVRLLLIYPSLFFISKLMGLVFEHPTMYNFQVPEYAVHDGIQYLD